MKKTSKKNVISVIMIIFLVLASIVLADRSYRLRKYEKLDYKETATTNYKVYLDDDSYYNSAFLDEGMQYISNIILLYFE